MVHSEYFRRGMNAHQRVTNIAQMGSRVLHVLVLCAVLVLPYVITPIQQVLAATDQQRLNDLQQQSSSLNKQIQENQAAANSKKQQAATLSGQVEELSSNIDQTQQKINDLDGQIGGVEGQIGQLQNEINLKQEELLKQQQNRDETIRVLYETQVDNLLFMVVGTSSISDVIDHNEYLQALETQIESVITQVNELKQELEAKQADLKAKQTELEGLKAQQEAYKVGLGDEKAKKDALLTQTQQEQKSYESKVADAKKLNAQVEGELSSLRSKLAGGSGPGVIKATDRGTSAVGFQWPANYYYISTYFGGSTPFQPSGGHGGLDLPNGSGTPIYAAADGTVTAVTEMRLNGQFYAYGRYVVIGHNARWSTLYAHLQSFAVSPGSEVKRGQIIGYMGSTGWSTGPHLHFEIWDYSNRVNPLNYLP